MILAVSALVAAPAVTAQAAGPKAAVARKSRVRKIVRPTNAVNKIYLSKAAALDLWGKLKSVYARVEGTIVIDPAVQPYLLGTCADIIVRSYDGQVDSSKVVNSVKAFGDIKSGQCEYVMYMAATSSTRMYSWYGGPANSSHPGDYLEINATTAQPFAAVSGGATTFDFKLTYDWIK
jgi:hypothetical protein